MPVTTWMNDDKKAVMVYDQKEARAWSVTDAGLDAAIAARKQAGSDVQHWAGLKSDAGRFAKDQMKAAQRVEKAATIWINHFTQTGKKSVRNMPTELASELDAVWRAMVLA